MAHFALLWKARTIEKYRQNYEDEKHNSIIMSNADIPDKTLFQRWKHYSHDVQKHLSRTFSKWYPEGTTVSNFLVNFRTEMRFPHILLRHLFGFIGGLILTYLCSVFLVFQLSLPLVHATVLSSLFGVLITLGLTFSNRMRCLVFLLIPQLFSRAGRYTLTSYALVLILTGPATNTLKNSEVLSESMACSQEQIKTSVREINESIKKPYNSIKGSIELMVKEMKRITVKLRSVMLKINRLILSIASLIQSNFSWLESVAQSCNNQLGTPYHRCLSALKTSVDSCKDCSDKAPWYYAATSVAKVACGVLKPYEKFCVASDFAGETFYATMKRKVKTFTSRVSAALFVKIRTRHSYTFVGNTSSPSQVAAGIVTEIRNRANPILTWLSWSSCVTSLFLLLIISRAKHYQHMYNTRSRFDNRYITKEFRELDLKRLREGRETVLPLNRRERAKYVTTTSFRLVASEKIYINRSAIFMTITSFKLLIHIVADYSLYWVLMTIRHHGALQSSLEPDLPTTGAHVTGTGFVSRLLRALINTQNIPLEPAPPLTSCLPNPHPPDFKRYSQIGTLIFLLWVFGLFEPYGLRLRHLIMGHYKPERAKTRAAWLYNHILRTRARLRDYISEALKRLDKMSSIFLTSGSFMKFARRKLHREYKYCSENTQLITYRQWLYSLLPFQWLRCLSGKQLEEAHCLLCNIVEDPHDPNTELIRCEVPNCLGTYCISCFSDIGQMCTICLAPSDYGDLSDVSLEKGSSDDDDENDDKNDGEGFNNDSIVQKRTDLDESFKNDNNFHTNGETDNESEYSGKSKEFDSLIHRHIEMVIQKNNNNNVLRIDNDCDKLNKSIIQMPEKNINHLMQNCVNNYEITKQVLTAMDADRDILQYKQNPYIFYSFYTINVQDMSFVVTKNGKKSRLANELRKKIGRNKKKTSKKKYCLFLTCGNGERKGTQNIANDKENNEKSVCEKNDPDKKQNCDNNSHKKLKDDKAMKPNKHNIANIIKVCSKKSNSHIESFHNKCSKYWKNISYVLSCTDIDDTNKDLPAIEEKKHKRKKKHNKCVDTRISKKHDKSKLNNEDARQYRISTYLADQDWKKKRIDDKVNNGTSLLIQAEENEIEVNHIKIPRLNLHFSSESLNYNEENQRVTCKKDLPKVQKQKKELKMGALDRFIKRISLTSIKPNSSKVLSKKVKREKQRHALKTLDNSNFSMSRSIKYFKSLGINYGQAETHESCACNVMSNSKLKTSIASLKSESVNSKVINETTFNENAVSVNEIKPEDNLTKTKIIKVERNKSKKSFEDLSKKWSNMKRRSSERFLGFGFKGPLVIMKDLYTSLFAVSDSNDDQEKTEEAKEIETKKETADKGVEVYPCMQSCGCQKSQNYLKREDRCIQVEQKEKQNRKKPCRSKSVCDVQVNAVHPTCTCATQYYITRRDVGTLKTQNSCRDRKSSETELSEDSEFSSDSESASTIISDETQTNTTVCSVANVDYRNEKTERENRRKRIKVKVVTKANRSTLTDKADVCDVSTVTYDWWSPIIEKKEPKKAFTLEKKEPNLILVREKGKRLKNKGIITDGRIVTFRSRAQIIPSNSSMTIEDILSPSRYLLESQKYYNELFSSKLYSPHVFPVSYVSKHQKLEYRSPVSSRHQSRRGRRTKRLEECYTRKQQTPRKKRTESSKTSDSTRQVQKTLK